MGAAFEIATSYLFESEPGQRFLQLAKPAIIEMERPLPDIQQELNDRGLSLRQALEASAEIAGPVSLHWTFR